MNRNIFDRQIDTDTRFEVGQAVWAWQAGEFLPATIVTAASPSQDTSPSTYGVAFEDGAGDPVNIPVSLLRPNQDQEPDSLAAHEWHNQRRKLITRDHPEIRQLTPISSWIYSLIMSLLMLLHLGVGVAIAFYPTDYTALWTIALAATVGAFCAYALQQLTHEVCHKPRRRLNRILVLLADFLIGTTGPGYYSYYFHAHLRHHGKTGDVGDPDLIFHGHWSVLPKWAARSRLGRFAWITIVGLFTFEVMLIEHLTGRVPQHRRMSLRNIALVVSVVGKYGFMLLTFWLGGLWCFLYFRLAAGFSLGAFCHPYAGFWLMQHAARFGNGYQPTVSYSGSKLWHWLNLGELYHVEHHDFPLVPFTKAAAIQRIAPEYYQSLYSVPSVWRLIFAWVSHTDGTPWMDVAGVLNAQGPVPSADHRLPSPSISTSGAQPTG